MKTIERKKIELHDMEPSPLNRWFPVTGVEWEEFAIDIAERGIQEELMVRRVVVESAGSSVIREEGKPLLPRPAEAGTTNGGEEEGWRYVLVKGHRRHEAGIRGDVPAPWCLVVECSDEEAFDLMWGDNLFRENVTPADEARAVEIEREVFGKTVEEIAAKWKRSVHWIETRQGLLALGDEVMEAVRRRGPDRLSMGAVEEILRCPVELRGDAVQMVLHPALELHVLTEEQARETLRRGLLEPRAAAEAWEKVRAKVQKGMRKDLEKHCLPRTKGDLIVGTKRYDDAENFSRGHVEALERVPLEQVLPGAPEVAGGLRWLHLAVKHTVPVLVVPGKDGGEPRAVVNQRMVMDCEAACAEPVNGWGPDGEQVRRAEHAGVAWVAFGKRKAIVDRGSKIVDGEEKRGEEDLSINSASKRVAKAEADLEAGYDTGYATEEKAGVVIEQGMERSCMIRMGRVERVRQWAFSGGDVGLPMEEVPPWALGLPWDTVVKVCEWVEGLRV